MSIPTILTKRLILDKFTLDDCSRVEELAGNKLVSDTTATIPHPYPKDSSKEWIAHHLIWFLRGDAVTFAIRLKDGPLIGCVSLGISKKDDRAELGYWIGVDYWNKGYATEASFACIEFGFKQFSLNKITSRHLDINPSSGRVMEKLGMIKEGYLKQHFKKNGVFHDVIEYALIKQ